MIKSPKCFLIKVFLIICIVSGVKITTTCINIYVYGKICDFFWDKLHRHSCMLYIYVNFLFFNKKLGNKNI